MVVCKFWTQGRCRFGDKCWHEHPSQNKGFNQSSQNVFRNQASGGKNPYVWLNSTSSTGKSNSNDQSAASPQDIIGVISRDVEVWQQSKMWPFSCYAYAGSLPSFPGFEDVSAEEMRYEAYVEGQATRSFNNYKNKEAHLAAENKAKQDQLKTENLNPSIKAKLLSVVEDFKKLSTAGSSAKTNLFGNSSSSVAANKTGLFGKPVAAVTGSNAQNNNPFGGSNAKPSLFNGTNVFGGSAAQTNNNIFGGSSSSSGLFTKTPAGLFGKNRSASGNNSDNLFGRSTTVTVGGLFGKVASTNVFGGNATNSNNASVATSSGNTFGQPSTFGFNLNNQTSSTSNINSNNKLFGGQTTGQTSLFGKVQPAQKNLFGNVPSQNASAASSSSTTVATATGGCSRVAFYTPLSELTDAEKQQYMADKFTIGCIPVKPPPREFV
ncbi:nucleoporin NUP42-like [Tubulanus polymorphus]|uniref:nucleoporin NUP42-like n=1 Tax=Tubulanus polymorphus TaxID=672921 RepID=UPI003DA28056